ncbi:hypothetical protein U2I54_21300 [Bacillus pseudomycoides]|uniref:Uncharacterized protein n=1 Tax=Bacillus bingmayongensis TaxID=1150157 RepID=A0ABU5K1J7_9BACI|nr:hypothetical protein [Bacillus pseudomycoides]
MLEELLEGMFDDVGDREQAVIANHLGEKGFCKKKVVIQKGMLSFYTKEFSIDQEMVGNHFNARINGEQGVILSWVTDRQEVTGIYIETKEIDRILTKSIKVNGKDTYIINTRRSDYCIIKQN